jgi:Holliday junction resolvase RusA-like endonuclease
MYEYHIIGTAIPQGSKAVSRAGFLYESNKNLKGWRKHATETLIAQHHIDPIEGAIAVRINVKLSRPKTVTRKHMTVKPDVDKLARAILDSATDAGIWKDDAQVVDLRITKDYTLFASSVNIYVWKVDA